MLSRVVLSGVAISDFALVFAVEEIPGWTDMGNLAKVSIIGFLCMLMLVVVVALLRQNVAERKANLASLQKAQAEGLSAIEKSRVDSQKSAADARQDFRDEIANARKHQETVIERVCVSFEAAGKLAHIDSEATRTSLGGKLDVLIRSDAELKQHCASVFGNHNRGEGP